MGAQHVQGHGRGLESKARKRPWPRFIASFIAIMLILVVSCYFYCRVFCLPCAWPSMGHHIIHLSPGRSPSSRHPAFIHTLLSPRGSPVFGSGAHSSPARTVGLGWVERDVA
jgi:hypothetical protein